MKNRVVREESEMSFYIQIMKNIMFWNFCLVAATHNDLV